LSQPESNSFWGFYPGLKPKNKFTGGAIIFNGWVISKQSPSKQIVISYEDKILDTIPVNQLRPGLMKKYPELPEDLKCGFLSSISLLGIPNLAELLVEVVLEDGSKIALSKVYLQVDS